MATRIVQHAIGAAERLISDAAAALNEGDLGRFFGASTGDGSHATGATVTARARGAVKQPASFGERRLKSRTRPSPDDTQRARLARTQTRHGSDDGAAHPRGRAQGQRAR